ncbi:hypothetical protein HanPI659440_Chr03g0095891 [Helianthus annuus]|nr:hypothetical protein HanPI659440_Chr03g0095891 [Helianthus annuus]
MLQSGSWLIKVLGAPDDELSSFFRPSITPTRVPFTFVGACALVLTCKPLEDVDFDLIPRKSTLPNPPL